MYVVHPFHLVPLLLVPLAAQRLLRRGVGVGRAVLAAVLALLAGEALLLLDNQAEYQRFQGDLRAAAHAGCQDRGGGPLAARRLRAARRLHRAGGHRHLQQRRHAGRARAAAHLRPVPRRQPDRRPAEAGTARTSAMPPAALDALPYRLIPHARVLLAGASGGFRIAEVLALGASQVDVLEPEPVLLRRAAHGLGPVAAWPTDPRVRIAGDGPLAAAQPGGAYDVVDLSADFLDAAEANATAFTAEAIAGYLRALAPGGIVSIPVSIRDFPVYAAAHAGDGARGAAGRRHRRSGRPCRGLPLRLERPHPAVAATAGARRAIASRAQVLRRALVRRVLVSGHRRRGRARPASTTTCRRCPSTTARSSPDGPDDAIADEAGAVLAGEPTPSREPSTCRRSRWTGRSSMPCCGWTSSAPS